MSVSKKNILIIIADDISLDGFDTLLKYGCSVIVKTGLSNNELLNYLKGLKSDISAVIYLIIRSVRNIDKDFIQSLSCLKSLKYICTASSGTDHIDIEYAKKSKIKIINTPDANYISAAEHTFGLILSIVKNINNADFEMRNNIFTPEKFTNYELYGKILGIVGVGRVGSRVAKYARVFGLKILGNDIDVKVKKKYPWIKFVSLKHLLMHSDIISFHTPLNNSTENLLNRYNISLLKKNAILINTSRGSVIQESALISMLNDRKIYYAGIDVFQNEPYFNKEFTKLDNVILTPHLAGKTTESKKRISLHLVNAIKKTLRQ